jgi:DNA-binding GntR family transcriptional regulator
MARSAFQELLQVRLSLEPQLARRATELVGFGAITRLEATNRDMRAAAERANVKAYLAANYEFHFALYGAAQSEVALPIVEGLWMRVGPFLHAVFQDTKGIHTALDHHEEILAALRRRDPVQVAEAVVRDLSDAADTILASVTFVSDRVDADVTAGASKRRQPAARVDASRERRKRVSIGH